MARYLLIEFDDNAGADRMRAQIDNAEAAGKPFRVVAQFSEASKLCECPTRSEKSVRGAKFGWWLCPECRRPKPGSPQSLSNMLDDEECPSKYREIFLSVRWVWDEVAARVKTVRSVPKNEWR